MHDFPSISQIIERGKVPLIRIMYLLDAPPTFPLLIQTATPRVVLLLLPSRLMHKPLPDSIMMSNKFHFGLLRHTQRGSKISFHKLVLDLVFLLLYGVFVGETEDGGVCLLLGGGWVLELVLRF